MGQMDHTFVNGLGSRYPKDRETRKQESFLKEIQAEKTEIVKAENILR